MISFFRRLISSKIGLFVMFGFLGLIAVAFVTADMSNTANFGPAGGGESVAEVGDAELAGTELVARTQQQFENARAESPELQLSQFVREGGFDSTLDRLINGMIVEEFARSQGLVVSRRLEDGEIASIPAFRGATGTFDRTAFDAVLRQQGISEAQVRADVARDLLARQLVIPISGAARAPLTLVMPYASLLLEARTGQAGFVPKSAVQQEPAPTDAELSTYYSRNVARYTVPERRVLRYAIIDRERFAATPTDAEIAQAYQANQAQYAGRELRNLAQVILPDQAAANALAARVRGGMTLEQAASAAGFDAVTLEGQSRDAYAELSSPAVAQTVFSAQQGAIAGPGQSPLGWHVVRVDGIETIAGRPLAEVRDDIAAVLAVEKTSTALVEFTTALEDSIADGATFDEAVAANRLQTVTTPAVTENGTNPDAPGAAVAPEIAAIAPQAFHSEADDDPLVQVLVPDQRFAVVDVESVVPAAPRPLAQIRAQVAGDFVADRSFQRARAIATAVAAKVNAGTPLAQALNEAGVPLPAPETIGGRRQEIAQTGAVAPRLALMFSMKEGSAKTLEAPDRTGWHVVYLDEIERGDARGRPDLVAATQAEFGQVLGQEYVEQFIGAARAEVGVERDAEAIERVRRELTGAGGQ